MKALVIVNPTSGGGRSGRLWPRIREALASGGLVFDLVFTEKRGQGEELARKAVSAGVELVVAVGGDGSVNDVVNGMVADGRLINPEAVLGVIPCGTGNDLVRALGTPRETIAAARHLAVRRPPRRVDLGEVTCRAGDGKAIRRIFVNDAGLGFAAEVVERLERAGKVGAGTIPYLIMLIRTALGHRSQEVSLEVDGVRRSGKMSAVLVCNGQFTGGGMWVAPKAALNDGAFDVVATNGLRTREILWHAPRIYRGTHLKLRQVSLQRGRRVVVTSPQRFPVVIDGEPLGQCPAEFRLLPQALQVV